MRAPAVPHPTTPEPTTLQTTATRPSRRLRRAAFLAAALLLLAACGGGDDAAEPSAQTGGQGSATTPADDAAAEAPPSAEADATADGADGDDGADAGTGPDTATLLDPATCELLVGADIPGLGTLSQPTSTDPVSGTPGESLDCAYEGTGPDADFVRLQLGNQSFNPDAATIQDRIDQGFDTVVPDLGIVASVDEDGEVTSRITDEVTLTANALNTSAGAPVGVAAASEAAARAFVAAAGL